MTTRGDAHQKVGPPLSSDVCSAAAKKNKPRPREGGEEKGNKKIPQQNDFSDKKPKRLQKNHVSREKCQKRGHLKGIP